MDPIRRFVTVLERGGIDLVTAQSIIREHVGNYPDDVVRRWITGDVLPGLRMRGHLFEAATSDFEEIRWESSTFMGASPADLLPRSRELCDAARRNDVDALARRLGGGVPIDGWDDGEDYALGYAAEGGHDAIVTTLLRFGADPTTFAKGKENAYLRAYRSGSPAVARAMTVEGPRSSREAGARANALLAAAASEPDHPGVIDALAEGEPLDTYTLGAALAEAVTNDRVRTAARLIQLGAALDVNNGAGRTPLLEASEKGRHEIVAALGDAGARIERVDADGNTALHLAARAGRVETVETLIALGADPASRNAAGERPVDLLPGGSADLERALMTPMGAGPRWLDRAGTPVMFVFNRGVGLGFDPRSIDEPILFGGEHDGVHQISAEFMRANVRKSELEQMGSAWFLRWVDKLVRREDFSLEELMEAARAAGQPPDPRMGGR